MMTVYDVIPSPVGDLLLTGEDDALTGIFFEQHRYGPPVSTDWLQAPELFQRVREELSAYFRGERRIFSTSLLLRGTPFQQSVWKLLREIPYGETTTYGELAKRLGVPNASRAVGAAVGRNPVSIIVPCHRVVGSTGAVTGYAGGTDRKLALLKLEKRR